MNRTRHYIGTMLMLLVLGGMVNEAWAATQTVKVTYHVITLPFHDPKLTGAGKYRIEAIKKTETYTYDDAGGSSIPKIKLPDLIKSPLMTDDAYTYWNDVTKNTNVQIFPNNPSLFNTYDFTGKTSLAPNTTVENARGGATELDIYVTYDKWLDDSNIRTDKAQEIALDGTKVYNIEFRQGTISWFYALNMDEPRGNRGQAIPVNDIKDVADLASDGISTINNKAQEKYLFYFKWKFVNNDPYNIILKTAYTGDFIYTENKYYKKNADAQYFGSLWDATHTYNSWVTAEANYTWPSQNKNDLKPIALPGWFRSTDQYGVASSNGVTGNIYFSFSLLNHTSDDQSDYTLVASWGNVNDWVPGSQLSNKGQYLHMAHILGNPRTDMNANSKNYPGPGFVAFEKAEQIFIHEVRDYTYKVKTHYSNKVLSANMKFSDYAKKTSLIERVPDALKRKYVSFTGTYKEDALTNTRTTFEKLYSTDEPHIKKVREVWLDYTSSLPFEAGGTSTTYEELKWYNIYAGNVQYTAWYNNSGSLNELDTKPSSDHPRANRESHFAFIGDPYELYVVNRNASESPSSGLGVLALNNRNEKLVSTNTYIAVENNTTLTSGETYYTSNTGTGKFTSVGTEVSDDTHHYFTRENTEKYIPVSNGTALTIGNTYYTYDSATDTYTPFVAEEKVADDTHDYYEYYNNNYIRVPKGTPLTKGLKYYTYDSATGNYTSFDYTTPKGTGTNYYEKKDVSVWEIINESETESFQLRLFNSYFDPQLVTQESSGNYALKGDAKTAVKLWYLDLPFLIYTYYIIDNAGRIAVKASEKQVIGSQLKYESIPKNIRSSFLKDGKLTFKTFKDDTEFKKVRADNYNYRENSEDFTIVTASNDALGDANEYKNHIYVSYSDLPALSQYPLDTKTEYNVRLNRAYIYYDYNSNTIKSVEDLGSHSLTNGYLWTLGGEDPYAMTIRVNSWESNHTIRTSTKYVKVEDWEAGVITLVDSVADPAQNEANQTKFIIIGQSNPFEVMATTGKSVDASVTYYNLGRPDDNNTVKFYKFTNDPVPIGYEKGEYALLFELSVSHAHPVFYHLIDKSGKDLLRVRGRHAYGDNLQFPPDYWSPLVEKYHYYMPGQFTHDDTNDTYTLNNAPTEIFTLEQDVTDIYVTYDVNNLVDMQHTTMYLLKFAMGDDFRQEDGSDDLLPAVTPAQIEAMTAEQKEAYYNKYRAVYPYCNGDANFNIYSQYQYDVQQEGAASTRTRWAWYVQSTTHDPYHVMILSRQTETYKGLERSAYFATMQPEGYDKVVTTLVWPNISGVLATEYMMLGKEHQYQLVTTKPFEIKESANDDGTIDVTEEVRYTVDSFEQYWKTYDLIRRNLLKDKTDANPAGPADVPAEPSFVTGFTSNRTFLTTETKDSGMGWHAYSKMAKAKRWNGYNKEGEASKGWESREHWFQTVKMGSGYFDLIPTSIDPALVLLDQHGWEIMRKPMPYTSEGDEKEKKLRVLASYDSPMVKEYIFWSSAKKRSGFHQYYALDKRIGGDFTSTSLTQLPPFDSENVKDNKGNLNDQYVTYIVKDEYVQSYQPGGTSQAFLIRQGKSLAKKGTGTTLSKIPVKNGTPDVAKHIMANAGSLSDELWYVRPNVDIDREMGYPAVHPDWKDYPNAYEETTYSTLRVADLVENTSVYNDLLTEDAKKDFISKYGRFTFSNGFDPYNIQISSYFGTQYYFTIAMTSSSVEEGEVKGDYSVSNGPQNLSVTLAQKNTLPVAGNSYDNSKFAMTNQTFMAVQDADGNMQLMPRFDHSLRMRDFSVLVTPVAEVANPDKLFETQTQLYRPFVYNYRIIDNEGYEAMRYKWAGELMPQTPDHLKSPLATNFKYYRSATYDGGTKKYSITESTDEVTSPYEIIASSSMAGAGMNASGTNSNFVYVRYAYNEDADENHVLQGKWLTMKLNNQDVQYTTLSSTEGIYASLGLGSYSLTAKDEGMYTTQKKALTIAGDYYFRIGEAPASYYYKKVTVTVSGSTVTPTEDDSYVSSTSSDWENAKPLNVNSDEYTRKWQWKFLKNPYTAPDPYDVQLFNRSQTVMTDGVKVGLPMSANAIDNPVTASSGNTYQHFALLSHTDASGNSDGYALAVARTGLDVYPFLNGRSMSTTVGAKMEEDMDYTADHPESGFTSTLGSFHADDSRIQLTDEVNVDITYHVYTNGMSGKNAVKYGIEAISEKQLYRDISDNEFVATLPEGIRSPLLPQDWFLYYETVADMGDPKKEIKYLYGLYDNDVYVRYKLYDPGHTDYKVPNAKTTVDGHVARDPQNSNDSSLGLDEKLPYNIIWYNDKMMMAEKVENVYSNIANGGSNDLQNLEQYRWTFKGDDPYAIIIRHMATTASGKYVHATTCSKCSGTGKTEGNLCTDCSGNGFVNTCELNNNNTTFMLLKRDGYDYGVLAVTGHREKMLTDYGNQLTATDTDPTKFIIFTLGTLKVVYHLVIANIKKADGVTDDYETIPWRDPAARGTTHTWLDTEFGYDTAYESSNTKNIKGTSMRDLTSKKTVDGVAGDKYQLGETDNGLTYCYDVGRISLGDTLRVPNVFYRPNVVYTLFVSNIKNDLGDDENLNNYFKGMEIKSKRMGLNLDLIGKTIYINIVYSFNGDLESNSGDNFVLGLNENKWYTLETVVNKKTYLAQYTNAWGFELKEGRGSHYTNDFLWSPIGDPYGFQLFNRYMDVNSGDHNLGEKNRVIFSRHFLNNVADDEVGHDNDTHTGGQQILMGNYMADGKDDKKLVVVGKTTGPINPYPTSRVAENSVYELLSSTTPGYFRFHPMANKTDSVFFHPEWADDDRDGTNNFLVRLSATASEFTFNLTKELITPYFNRAGYVGGLKKSVYDELVTNNYPATTADGKENGYYNLAKVMLNADAEASAAQLRTAQTLVYNSANIVSLVTGYYRLHSPLGISGIDPARYASGYTHLTELYMNHTNGSEADAIPMHFYEKNSDEVRQFTDFKDGGFTSSPATQGDLTIPPVERDPASIFFFKKVSENADYPSTEAVPLADRPRYNLGYVSTQELGIRGTVAKSVAEFVNAGGTLVEPGTEGAISIRAKAVMTKKTPTTNAQSPKADEPAPLFVMDLGGGVLLIHDNYTTNGRSVLKYLSYDYSNDKKSNENTIYDLKLTNHTHTDHAKWCMQPVQSDVEKGVNEMGLKFTTSDYTLNNGGDGYYYTTFYAPFDVLLTDEENDCAYICEVWDTKMLHLRKVGRYNNTQNIPGLAEKYQGNNQFVPAKTPVVIRTKNTSVTMALPKNTPSPYTTENLKIVINGKVVQKDGVDVTVKNIFKGVCLEQILDYGADDVYVFGLPFESPTVVTKDKDYKDNGKYTVAYPTSADTGVGFYINVNYNRELGGSAGEWERNNKCVYSNKIFIRPNDVSPARQGNMEYELGFVPVVFDDDEEEEDEPIGESLLQRPHDNRVYDLLGRCVATGEEVANGTWRRKVASGIYILNGRKIYVK